MDLGSTAIYMEGGKQQMSEVKTIVRAGRVVPAHDKAVIPDGAVAVAG